MTQPKHIYRAAEPKGGRKPRPTRRQPGNVPYVVDNLWEWARQEKYPEYPNRRKSAYASPSQEQACKSARGDDQKSYRVEFQGKYTLAQLVGYEDAKYHPDCRNLKKRVQEKLDQDNGRFWWASQERENKHPAGQLYVPCLSAEEVNDLFDSVDVLNENRSDLLEAVTFWEDVELIEGSELKVKEGELFFEYDGGYKLVPVD